MERESVTGRAPTGEAAQARVSWLAPGAGFQTRPVLLVLFAYCLLWTPFWFVPVGRDQGVWLAAGRSLVDGGVFYRDFIHMNLPGTAYFYALAQLVSRDWFLSVKVLAFMCDLALILAAGVLAARLPPVRNAAVGMTMTALAWLPLQHWWNLAQKESIAIAMLMPASALVAGQIVSRRRVLMRSFAIGVLMGLAVQVKPTMVLFSLPLGLIWLWRTFRPGHGKEAWKLCVTACIVTVCAGILTVLPILLHLARNGALRDACECIFVLAKHYGGARRRPTYCKRFFVQLMWCYLPLALMSVVGILEAARRKDSVTFWILATWVGGGLANFFLQGKGFHYHALPILAALGIAAAAGFGAVHESLAGNRRVAAVLFAALLALMLRTTWRRHQSLWRNLDRATLRTACRTKNLSPAPRQELIRFLSNRRRAGNTLIVFGNDCYVYGACGMAWIGNCPFDSLIAIDIPRNTPAAHWQNRQRQKLLEDMAARPPAYVVIVYEDSNPVEPRSSNEQLAGMRNLHEFVQAHYRYLQRFGPYELLVLDL